ncbi:MAG: class D sortase [Armatimonadetes bacterium]|nr:class D sortase [Armatimonadota bacterium]
MQNLDKSLIIADLAIIAGLICVLVPVAWSFRSSMLQQLDRAEQERESHPADLRAGSRMRIIIPKLKLDAVVVEEVQESDLDKGPMHLAGTPRPGLSGNCCIAAHREKWFRRLDRLTAGDEVVIEVGAKSYTYLVTGGRVVRSDDASVLASTDEPVLSLITCTGIPYFGSGAGRLVIRAKEI